MSVIEVPAWVLWGVFCETTWVVFIQITYLIANRFWPIDE